MRRNTRSSLQHVVPVLVVACTSSQLRRPALAPRITPDAATPSARVYAAVLDAFHDTMGAALVEDSTLVVTPDFAERLDAWLKNRFTTETPEGFDEAIDDFRRRRHARRSITPIPTERARVAYVTEDFAVRSQAYDGRSLRQWFKCADWRLCTFLHSFTPVGFNSDSTQAVLYHRNWCSGLCGSGLLLFLERRTPASPWRITKETILWAS